MPNVYKEAAWRLTLNGFPTAARMHNQQQSPCEACGVLGLDVGHHFWSCPVAVAVRQEIEGQLRGCMIDGQPMLAAGSNISCAALWDGGQTPSRPESYGMGHGLYRSSACNGLG